MKILTPKERAKEIIFKMWGNPSDQTLELVEENYAGIEDAIYCAKVAVDIILNDVGAEDWEPDKLFYSKYWEDVKIEIDHI